MEVKILLIVGLTPRQNSTSLPAHEDNWKVNLAVLSGLQSEKFNAVNFYYTVLIYLVSLCVIIHSSVSTCKYRNLRVFFSPQVMKWPEHKADQ